jgi:hypothetical protein
MAALEPTSPEALVALSRYFSADGTLIKQARALCTPGEHRLRGAVQFAGTLSVGQPYEALATPRLSGLQVATLFVVHLVEEGLSKAAALALAARVIDSALEAPSTDDALAKSEDPLIAELVRTKAQVQKRVADRLPREPRMGQTKFNGLVEPRAPAPTFGTSFVD